MKPDNKRQAARKFKEFWLLAKDSETGGYSKFWLSLLSDVLGRGSPRLASSLNTSRAA